MAIAALCVGLLGGVTSAATLKALIVDGQNNHDWKGTTPLIQEILEGTGLFEVEVATTPGRGKPMDGFAPKWSKYDVIVSNYNGASWPEKTRKAFVEYMTNGGGLVVVHAADNAFGNWPEWNEIIALGGWGGRNEKSGPYVYMKDGKWIRDESKGGGGSHGRQTPYAVTTREPGHPIMKGLPAAWVHVADELYCKLRGPAKNMTVLASGYSDAKTRGSGREEPVLMTIDYGKGRVFHTVLGHGPKQHKCVGFIVTLQRGTQWAATGKVTQAVPSDFPTADKESTREKNLCKDPKAPAAAAAAGIDFAAMVAYKADQGREAFTACEAQMRGASAAKLAAIEAGLLKVLADPKATFDARQYVCRLLRRCGSDACVPALAKLLADKKLAHMARYALQYLPGEKAAAAMRANLSKATGGQLRSAIDSVARRGDRKAVATIAKFASGSDQAVASAAIAALGRIGGSEAAKALATLKPAKANTRVWADAYLKAADSLAAEGKTADATAVYEKMYASGPETMTRVAALGGLARTGGAKAVPTLLAALKDKNADIQRAGGRFLMTVSGADACQQLADSLGSLTPEAQMLVIGVLGNRGAKATAPVVAKYAASKNEPVRLAAIRALATLGDASAIPVLLKQIAVGGETTNAARASLAKLSDKNTGKVLANTLIGDASDGVKAAVVEVLIARREVGQMSALLTAAADKDGTVASAGAKALGVLGTPTEMPKLIAMLLATKDAGRQDRLAQAIGSIASRNKDAGGAGAIVAAIAKANPTGKASLVAILPRIADAKALAAVRAQLKSSDVDVRKAAVRAMGDWPSMEPADDLLGVAKATSGAEGILAIRGVVNLVTKVRGVKPADGVAKLAKAMKLASRPEEKRSILAALPAVACKEGVQLAESMTKDPGVAKEATDAVERIKKALKNPRRRRRR